MAVSFLSSSSEVSFQCETTISEEAFAGIADLLRAIDPPPAHQLAVTSGSITITGSYRSNETADVVDGRVSLSFAEVPGYPAIVQCKRCGLGRSYRHLGAASRAFACKWKRHRCARGTR